MPLSWIQILRIFFSVIPCQPCLQVVTLMVTKWLQQCQASHLNLMPREREGICLFLFPHLSEENFSHLISQNFIRSLFKPITNSRNGTTTYSSDHARIIPCGLTWVPKTHGFRRVHTYTGEGSVGKRGLAHLVLGWGR